MPASNKRSLISFDYAIKNKLRKKSNYDILEGFLSVLLCQQVVIISLPESEGNKDNANSKANKVDILCENNFGELILIELQYYSEVDYLQRMLFGASKLITDHLESGQKYDQVKKVYSINIVYFDLGQGTDYVYYGKTAFFGLHDQDELQMNETLHKKMKKENIYQIFPEYYIIKVNNFDNIVKNPLDEWIYYFKNNKLPKGFKAKGLEKVEAELKLDAMNTQEKIEYNDYMKSMGITESMFETAQLEGEIKGRRKERDENNRTFTISLIKNTEFDNEKISILVGVDASFVKTIREEMRLS